MLDTASDMQASFWGPLCQVWHQRISAAKTARKPFDYLHDQCLAYYGSTAGFMWKDDHKSKFFGGNLPAPKFKITVNKAYEFVSIYGPSLFWQYPHRKVMTQRVLELTPEIFGDPNDPQVQQIFQQFAMQDAAEQSKRRFANSMMEIYLGYSQREQSSGLMSHAISAIKDALLSGRGVLWPETYTMPDMETPYTRLKYGNVRNLYIDPDCNDPQLESAGYIMRRHVSPIWQVEQIFGLEKGRLRSAGNYQSGDQVVRNEANEKKSKTFDCIEWYEIWSKVGVGPRMNGHDHAMLDTLDETLGDYAYLCIAPTVHFPLNAPPERFYGEDAMGDEEVRAAFEWRSGDYGHPFPCWKDNRWPVALLDFNPMSTSPWPMAPLAPAMGELIAINILTSAYADIAWENRRTIVAYLKSAAEDVKKALTSDAAFVDVEINDNAQKSIKDVISLFNRPNANTDILQALDILQSNFDKRVGLNELLYGESSRQVRVAADIRERSSRASVRPDKMAGDVATFITNASQLEMFLASKHVEGASLTHLLGQFGGHLWDQEIRSQPDDVIFREMKATVEASEVRRPDKERDTANVQGMQQYWLPFLADYAKTTSDTGPINGFLDKMGDAMEMDTKPFHLPPWQPPTDPEQQQLQQQSQQLELQKLGAEVEDKQAGALQKQATAQKAMVDAAATMADSSIGADDVKEMTHEQKLRHVEEQHTQKIIHDQEAHVQQLLFQESEALVNEALTVATAVGDNDEEES